MTPVPYSLLHTAHYTTCSTHTSLLHSLAHTYIHTLFMLLFCPLCGGLLLINSSQNNSGSSFICKSCIYTFPISDKNYSARVELTRKKVDDVLGGEDAWKNVDSTDGNYLYYILLIFIYIHLLCLFCVYCIY